MIAAGAEGIELLPQGSWQASPSLEVAIDLNAVPPLGIAGIAVQDKATENHGKTGYGAIGVGGTKMKIHTAALKRLFEANAGAPDPEAIYRSGEALEA